MTAALARRSPPALALLLRRRPDVVVGAPPRDLADLGLRLAHPQSLVRALQELPMPHLHTAEAALAFGGSTTRSELAGLLDGAGDEHRKHVDEVVDELVDLAVLIDRDDGRIVAPDGLTELFPSPLGLGPPLRSFLGNATVDAMRRIATRLGLPRPSNKTEAIASLAQHLSDADAVRRVVASAPAEIRDLLLELAAPRPARSAEDDDDASEDFYPDEVRGRFDPSWYGLEQAATRWAADRGLVFSDYYSYGWRMPAEIGRALRGPDYRAPFTPVEPAVPSRAVAATTVETEAGASVSAFADLVLALLDHVVRAPIPALKSGGVGARELTRLTKVLGCDETTLRLALELADRAALLDDAAGRVGVSSDFDAWRDAEPADRLVSLLDAWWSLGATPTGTVDQHGKSLRVLARPPDCEGCRVARVVLIETLAGIDGAADPEPLAARALWRRPLVHLVDGEMPFTSVVREARLLGVIALGALTGLGRALLSDDAEGLRSRAVALLPRSSDTAIFGADLTAYVAGMPSGRVTGALDSAADREGRGGAVTWRFSPASIRRAFDDGATGDALLERLTAVAGAELPQPLRFLIADVARRHGNLRLTAVACCVRSDDEALLAEVAADRKLSKLGLRLLAPTVLASETAHDALIAALRKAGYFPVSEDTRAEVITLRDPRQRAARRRPGQVVPPASGPDLDELAGQLLRAGAPDEAARFLTGTERVLGGLGASLSIPEIRQLAHAIDTGSRVAIAYESASGALTQRVIGRAELSAGSVYAWCELRRDERVFTVSRIRAVSAV